MINNTDINRNQDSSSEGISPLNEANQGSFEQSESKVTGKLKSYGKKSLSPLVDLVHKYQDEITPYFDAIAKGLQAGVDSLGGQSVSGQSSEFASNQTSGQSSEGGPEAEKVVAGWFREAANGLNEARGKLSGSNPQEFLDYVEAQAQRHPGFMFSSSYLAGLFFGRIGRHIGRKKFGHSQSGRSFNENTNWSGGDSFTH